MLYAVYRQEFSFDNKACLRWSFLNEWFGTINWQIFDLGRATKFSGETFTVNKQRVYAQCAPQNLTEFTLNSMMNGTYVHQIEPLPTNSHMRHYTYMLHIYSYFMHTNRCTESNCTSPWTTVCVSVALNSIFSEMQYTNQTDNIAAIALNRGVFLSRWNVRPVVFIIKC